MKTIFPFILLLLSIAFKSNAQTKIPPPSYADALKNLKASTSVWNELKTNYGVASQAEVKIIENPDKSYGFSYSSYALPYNYKFPPDLIMPSFTIITKKQADGSYFEIPVSVVYRRSTYETRNDLGGGNYISYTNTYSYYWCEIGAPTAVGKKMLSLDDRANLFFAAVEKYYNIEKDPNYNEYAKCIVGTSLMDVVQFKNFSEYSEEQFRVSTLNAFEEKWQFNCNAIIAEFNKDKSEIIKLREWEVEIAANAKLENGKWQIIGNSANSRPFYFTPKDIVKDIHISGDYENKPYDTLYATLENISINQLSKKTTVIQTPIASEKAIYTQVLNPLKNILTSKSSNETELINKLIPLFKEDKATEYATALAKQIVNWNKETATVNEIKISLRRGADDVENKAANRAEQFVNKPLYLRMFFELAHTPTKKKQENLNGKRFILVNEDLAPEGYLGDYIKIGFNSEKGKWFIYGNFNEYK